MILIFTQRNFYEPDPPSRFRWLRDGELYPVQPEQRGNSVYWYMRKMIAGKQHTVYLGGIGQLSTELLDNAVTQLEAQAEQVTQ